MLARWSYDSCGGMKVWWVDGMVARFTRGSLWLVVDLLGFSLKAGSTAVVMREL